MTTDPNFRTWPFSKSSERSWSRTQVTTENGEKYLLLNARLDDLWHAAHDFHDAIDYWAQDQENPEKIKIAAGAGTNLRKSLFAVKGYY